MSCRARKQHSSARIYDCLRLQGKWRFWYFKWKYLFPIYANTKIPSVGSYFVFYLKGTHMAVKYTKPLMKRSTTQQERLSTVKARQNARKSLVSTWRKIPLWNLGTTSARKSTLPLWEIRQFLPLTCMHRRVKIQNISLNQVACILVSSALLYLKARQRMRRKFALH